MVATASPDKTIKIWSMRNEDFGSLLAVSNAGGVVRAF